MRRTSRTLPVLVSALTIAAVAMAVVPVSAATEYEVQEYAVPTGSHPHDVAPAPEGGVWYTGQRDGTLGLLDPVSGKVTVVPLGPAPTG